jgi:hypothetical protein
MATLHGLGDGGSLRVRPLGPLAIRGKREPVEVFVLDGL